jgi:hypothetical protein
MSTQGITSNPAALSGAQARPSGQRQRFAVPGSICLSIRRNRRGESEYRRDMRNRRAAVLGGLLAVLVVAACGGEPGSGDASSTAASADASAGTAAPSTTNPYGVPSIDPAGPDEPILTVEGGSTPLSLTLDQLNALGDVTISIDEPFVKKRQTFRGVPLAAVLSKAGIPDTATIDTVALNDYRYASAVAPMVDSQALLATSRDGAPIPYDQGGPIRIVFPDGTPLSTVLDAWNWSLASISVTDRQPPTS